MDNIGSSYIALPDLIIFCVTIALYWCLTTAPPNSLIGRVLALVSGFIIVSIIVVIPTADNLSSDGIKVLSFSGISLALGLLRWDRTRGKTKLTLPSPPEY
jgi:hypothetical protein